MRLLIVGESSPELDKAASLAVARGAEVRRVRDSETALRCLREGQGADLLLIDVRQDIRLLVGADGGRAHPSADRCLWHQCRAASRRGGDPGRGAGVPAPAARP